MTRCDHYNGFGEITRLLMGPRLLSKLSELAKIAPDEPVPTRKERCPVCYGTGQAMAKTGPSASPGSP